MDVSSPNWLSEQEMEWLVSPLDDDDHSLDFDFRSFPPADVVSSDKPPAPQNAVAGGVDLAAGDVSGRPAKKFRGAISSPSSSASSSPHIICFGSGGSARPKAEPFMSAVSSPRGSAGVVAEAQPPPPRRFGTATRTPVHAQDHVMAERKRREKLSQRFVALSAIVPGLKKMDKASVLGDAIKYVKRLQDQVRILQEQTKKRTVESVVFVKRSQLSPAVDDDGNASSVIDEECSDGCGQPLPEIEAKFSDKDVLIRVHCEKQNGTVASVTSELEKLELTVVNCSALAFGDYATDVTIIAKMEEGFHMTVKDLVSHVRQALQKFM